jgi:uncharacterized Fe-S cluster-containing radical SAM superfamily protein
LTDVASLAQRIRRFDPLRVSDILEKRVQRGTERKYFRFRYSRFYGGSAVGDVVGCNLRCVFCWTGRPRDDPRVGFWVSPEEAARRLLALSRRGGYVRLSAGEPTLGWNHLVALLDALYERSRGRVLFILETNGILIGAYRERARLLAEHPLRPYVRVSIKACSPQWFKVLTGAKEYGLELQIRAVEELYSSGASLGVAIFAAFGEKECWAELLSELARRTSSRLVENIEVEPLVMYPTTARRLKLLGIKPTNPELVYTPG